MLVAKVRVEAKEFVTQKCMSLGIRTCLEVRVDSKILDSLGIPTALRCWTVLSRVPESTEKGYAKDNGGPIREVWSQIRARQ